MSGALERARSLLADALNVETASLSAEASVSSTEVWDSLAHARVIAAIEAKLGSELDAMEILKISQLSDIADILERHSAAS